MMNFFYVGCYFVLNVVDILLEVFYVVEMVNVIIIIIVMSVEKKDIEWRL